MPDLLPTGFEHVRYHTIYKTPDVHCEIEEMRRPCDGAIMLLVHARCARWTARLFREFKTAWDYFRTIETRDIFASPQFDDVAKWQHFVSLFGFVPLIENAMCNDGRNRPIYIHKVSNGQ